MAESPVAPIFDTRAHLVCRTGPLQAWITSPPGVVIQLMQSTKMTASMAHWAVGPAFDGMLARYPGGRDFIFLIDVREMTDRDPEVRLAFMKLARESGALLSAAVIVPPRQPSPLYLAALQTASALVSAFGPALEVTAALPDVLQRYRLVAAPD
jgi:hypothetical protein